jgi:ferredoxin-NADP reductase
MYRLILYYLASLLVLGFILSLFGALPVKPLAILSTTVIYLVVCYGTNWLFARFLRVHSNPESSLITALILALISGPVSVLADPRKAAIFALAGLVAMASKYLLVIRKQHIFNPAAFGILVTDLVFGLYSSWWVGNIAMLPLVVVGGILLLRRISRFRFVASFFAAFIVFLMALSIIQGLPFGMAVQSVVYVFLHTEIVFFAFVMLTEPLTSPKRFSMQVLYTIIVAFIFQPQLTIGGMNFTPEEALLIGNLFSFLVSPSFKLSLRLKERREIGNGILAFSFDRPEGFNHRLGQYMEWTLPVTGMDNRGNRRYFSIASSPTESELMIAARFYPRSSTYKQELSEMKCGDPIVAAELSGDFVLPKDPSVPLAFIAGGIGITPFRSMIKYLVDVGEKRDIVLLYSNYASDEIVFADVFEEAKRSIGLKVVYTLTDENRLPEGWNGRTGFIGEQMLREEVPVLKDRMFFVSGSPGMVDTMKGVLAQVGVKRRNIRSDYFPGYSA